MLILSFLYLFCEIRDNVMPINFEYAFQLLVKPGLYLEFPRSRLCHHYCEYDYVAITVKGKVLKSTFCLFKKKSDVFQVNIFFFLITVWKLAQKFSSLNPDLNSLQKIRSVTTNWQAVGACTLCTLRAVALACVYVRACGCNMELNF